jgi:hypothetical protein
MLQLVVSLARAASDLLMRKKVLRKFLKKRLIVYAKLHVHEMDIE